MIRQKGESLATGQLVKIVDGRTIVHVIACEVIGTCSIFVEMYCEIALKELLEPDCDVELPKPVSACALTGRPEKNTLSELQVIALVTTWQQMF